MKTSLNSVGAEVPRDPVTTEAVPGGTSSMPSASNVASAASRQPFLKKVTSFPVLLATLLVAAVFVPLRDFNVDPDLWWHLKVGQGILSTHRWPTMDTYSFTVPGSPWIAYEWLGEALLAGVHAAWGLRGLMMLNLALGSAILLGLYALASLRSGNSKAAFVASALLLPFAVSFFTLRPQMWGYLFLIVTLIVLERFREGRTGTLWLLPPLFLVWVNTHGSFAIGLFAVAVYCIGGLVKYRCGGLESILWTPVQRVHLGLVIVASLLALAVTPYGTKLAAYPLDMAFSQPVNVANIKEWQPMPFNLPVGQYFLVLLVGFVLAQIVLRLAWQLPELTLFLAGVVAACLHVRFLLVFVPFSAPLFAVILSRWVAPYAPGKDKHALNAFLITAVIVCIVWFLPSRAQVDERVAENWPVKAVAYLEQQPPPLPMFNSYTYGGYLLYKFDGRNKVFVDGRADIYERAGVLVDYRSITWLEPKALSLLQSYNVQSCFIGRNEPLATLLSASPQWKRVYADDMSALFVRNKAADRSGER